MSLTSAHARSASRAVLLAAAWVLSCSAPRNDAPPVAPRDTGPAGGPGNGALQLVREAARRSRELRAYTLRFTRWERRGLLQRLEGPEHIEVWFRREPFSLRMKWLDEDLKYGESVYIEGRHGNKVRFTTRWWSPPLLPPPQINSVDLMTPVMLGEARRPLSEFGLEKMMDRLEAAILDAGARVRLEDEGLAPLYDGGPTVRRVRITYDDPNRNLPRQLLSIDPRTRLPAGLELRSAADRVDSVYFYEDIQPHSSLPDEAFLLEAERSAARPGPADAADSSLEAAGAPSDHGATPQP